MTLTEKEYISRIWWLWFKTHIGVAHHSFSTNGFIFLNLILFAFTYLGAIQISWVFLAFILIMEGWFIIDAFQKANWQVKEIRKWRKSGVTQT